MNARHASPARAFTIIELLLALAISAVVMSSVPLMISLSARAAPTSGSIQVAASETTNCFAQLTSDLQIAQAITAVGTNSITMLVPARDGSDTLQTITYAWSGTAGDPVTVDIDGQASILVAAAEDFTLGVTSGVHPVYSEQTFTTSTKVVHQTESGSASNLAIPPSGSCIQEIAAPAGAGVIGWTIEELVIYVGCSAPAVGKSIVVSIVPLNADRSPATGAYYTYTIPYTDLKVAVKKHTLTIPPVWVSLDQPVGIEVTTTSTVSDTYVGFVAASVAYAGGPLYVSTTATGPWAVSTGSVLEHEVTGSTLTATGGAADRTCLERLDVSITTGDGGWVFATSITPLNRVSRP